MNICQSSAGNNEESEDKGQEIRDWKNHTGRSDRERRKKKSQMSRGSWCCIPICTSRNGSGGAGKQVNGMNESANFQSQRIQILSGEVEKGVCGVTDRKKSGRWVIFHQTPKNTLSFCMSVLLKGNQRFHTKASKNILTSYPVIRNMQEKKNATKSWEQKTKEHRLSTSGIKGSEQAPWASLCRFFWLEFGVGNPSFGSLIYIITG